MRDLPRPHKNEQIGDLSLWRHPAGTGEWGMASNGGGHSRPSTRPGSGITVGEDSPGLTGQGTQLPSVSQHEVVVPGLTGSSTPAPRLLSGCLPLRMHQGISEGGRQWGG